MRELLMLAQVYTGQDIGGWYMSEKLDGQRALWDGGISRGRPTTSVPWANLEKKVRPTATGLWTRYGNVIQAPDYFLDSMPLGVFLDGELWSGNLQILRTIVSRDVAIDGWKDVVFRVFGVPGDEILKEGYINNPQFSRHLRGCAEYIASSDILYDLVNRGTDGEQEFLRQLLPTSSSYPVQYLNQEKLPFSPSNAKKRLYSFLDSVLASGGEGVMLRHPRSFWTPKRSKFLLKVKPQHDAEAQISAVVPGAGRLVGMMGSLEVKWSNAGKTVTFNVGTGFTDVERQETWTVGDWITFKYTSLTNDGVPREGRFHRRYQPE